MYTDGQTMSAMCRQVLVLFYYVHQLVHMNVQYSVHCSRTISLSTHSLSLSPSHRLVVSQGCMVTSISYRTWISREARDPSLLVSCTDSTLRLYRILPDGNLYLKRKFPLPHTKQPLRSAFCPLMSFLQVHIV